MNFMRFSPGQKLGPYEIILSLGAGGMGEVWTARDTRLERTVSGAAQDEPGIGRTGRGSHPAAARKALDIDPHHPLALACAGMVSGALDWNWQEFERLMQQAYTLAPNDPDVTIHYAFWYLRRKGFYSEAIGIIDDIATRDPLSPNWPAFQASLAFFARDYSRATCFTKLALEIDGAHLLAHWLMCGIASRTGDVEQALASGAEALRLRDGNDWAQGTFATALAKAGRDAEALAIRDRLREAAMSRYVSPMALIDACIACGDPEGALSAMEQLAPRRSRGSHPRWKPSAPGSPSPNSLSEWCRPHWETRTLQASCWKGPSRSARSGRCHSYASPIALPFYRVRYVSRCCAR